jgi:cytochrome oxidase Cu insertion factor (SCO1/SenC/PrrC family)
MTRWRFVWLAAVVVAVGIGMLLRLQQNGLPPAPPAASAAAILANTPVDAGAILSARAPGFTLVDQYGRTVTLTQFRGKIIVLAFVDSQCTTICPLTTQSMVDAERMLGPKAASHTVLLGIDANPVATSVADVRQFSQEHGLMNRWLFLTGSRAELDRIWKAYGIYVAVTHGQIDHTPALYVIAPDGREHWVAQTTMEYRAVDTEALVLAQVVQGLLPSELRTALPRLTVPPPPASRTAVLPGLTATGPRGRVALGGHGATLVVFVASWAPDLVGEWQDLAAAERTHPGVRVVLVDIGTVEPRPGTFTRWMAAHPELPPLPVAFDATGQVADALGAQNIPESVLLAKDGHVLWQSETWPTTSDWKAIQGRLAGGG